MDERTTYIGQIRQFKLHASDWSIYKAHLINYFVANNINNSDKKRAILLTMLDEEAYKLILFLCRPVLPEGKDFEDLIVLFDLNLAADTSVFFERHKFYKAKKFRGESVEDWATRVEKLAATCGFGEGLDAYLRDRFIFGFGEEHLFKFLGNDVSLTFENAVKVAKENLGSSESYSYDFSKYCANGGFSYKCYDFENFLYASDWCLFYPCVLMERHRVH